MSRELAPIGVTVAVLLLGLLLVACGDDGAESSDTTSTTTSSSSSNATSTSRGEATTSGPTTAATDSSTPTTRGSTTLPGEPIFSRPRDGDELGVMGVAADDVLNVRAIPGADTDIVATAAPTDVDLESTGVARKLPSTIWYQVRFDGKTGWVNSFFVGFVGATEDATARFLDGRDRPETETMAELGELVAAEYGSTEPASRIVQSVAPTVGDLGEVTYDVIGLGDDSIAGYRLHVFGTPGEGGESFVLASIERTTFCARGLSIELCP